jgi:hypothetical protein
MYFAPHSDCVTNRKLLIGKLRIKSGCKGFTTSVLLQVSYTIMRKVTLKKHIYIFFYCGAAT